MSTQSRARRARAEARRKSQSSVDPVSSSPRPSDSAVPLPIVHAAASAVSPSKALQPQLVESPIRGSFKKPLRVMKFGGTSVGSASSIARVIEIIQSASRENNLVVVVSAMSGVTNLLVEAATLAEKGAYKHVAAIFDELRAKHDDTAAALIQSSTERNELRSQTIHLILEGNRLCRSVILTRKLSAQARDAISGLGERLAAPLVAATLTAAGVKCQAIDATEMIVTDANFGAAEPLMDQTRGRCERRLREMLRAGTIPVVTGFIGATADGVPTTLGRNSSDFSATILGAVLDADEVTIWSDVDGVLTADPRIVPNACAIPEISYREASELAYFGAKVLHPKTLHPVMQSAIPVRIRNTFAPTHVGSRITPAGAPIASGAKALASMSDVSLITVKGPRIAEISDALGRTFTTIATVHTDLLLLSQSSSPDGLSFVVPSSLAETTVDALKREFAKELPEGNGENIAIHRELSIVTVVGENMRGTSGIIGRMLGALHRENIKIIATTHGSSECNLSFVVAQEDMKAALVIAHRELELDTADTKAFRAANS
jgi:bifunctional aspartokinase / homoserine dehydrogenase 1